MKWLQANQCFGSGAAEITHPRNFLCLLRLGGCAKREQRRDEFSIAYCLSPVASSHLITLSARYSTDCGIVRPISFAVFKLITNSNFICRSTGRSSGLVPLRILST